MEVCKIDCTSSTDFEISENILNMTIKNYKLIKHNYINVSGLIMLTEGNVHKLEK
jgi:hypothetical protein